MGRRAGWQYVAPSAMPPHDLFSLLYTELKRMAHGQLYKSGGQAELDTTSLVHESWLRCAEKGWIDGADRAVFFGYVGRVMRSVVVDHIRSRQAQKRGGEVVCVTLTTGIEGEVIADERVLQIDHALDSLERLAPQFSQLVEMRYFAGLSVREVAELRHVSSRTVEREWEKARAFLYQLMGEPGAISAAGAAAS